MVLTGEVAGARQSCLYEGLGFRKVCLSVRMNSRLQRYQVDVKKAELRRVKQQVQVIPRVQTMDGRGEEGLVTLTTSRQAVTD